MDLRSYLNRIKIKIGESTTEKDAILSVIIEDSCFALMTELNESVIPPNLQWIVEEIAIKRYRRIGSEGLTQEKIEDITSVFEEDPLALAPYQRFIDAHNNKRKRKLRMF